MKRLVLTILFINPFLLGAQNDTIITIKDDTIICKITKVTSMNIFYTENKIGKSIPKNEVKRFIQNLNKNKDTTSATKEIKLPVSKDYDCRRIKLDSVKNESITGSDIIIYDKIVLLDNKKIGIKKTIFLYKEANDISLLYNFQICKKYNAKRNISRTLGIAGSLVSTILLIDAGLSASTGIIFTILLGRPSFISGPETGKKFNNAKISLIFPIVCFTTNLTFTALRNKHVKNKMMPEYYNFYMKKCK